MKDMERKPTHRRGKGPCPGASHRGRQPAQTPGMVPRGIAFLDDTGLGIHAHTHAAQRTVICQLELITIFNYHSFLKSTTDFF
jgi:hypothetical protein